MALLSTACNVETSPINATSVNPDGLDRAVWDVNRRDVSIPERKWVREDAQDNSVVDDDEKNDTPPVSPYPISPTLTKALGKKIAEVVPARLDEHLDESTFVDFDLGGLFNTRNRDLEGCTTANYNTSTGLLAVEYRCIDLNTPTAPDGTVLCDTKAVLTADQQELRAVELSCNFSIASLAGELSGKVEAQYDLVAKSMSVLVDGTFYKPGNSDVYLATSYSIRTPLSQCSLYEGSARVAHQDGSWMNAQIQNMERCNNTCEPTSGNIEFTLEPTGAWSKIAVESSGQVTIAGQANGANDFTPCI
jgi:hypothetical protein